MPAKPTFSKIVFLGAPSVGKTSVIEQIVYGNYHAEKEMHPTIEDTYDAWIDADKGQKERIRIYDLKGLDEENPVLPYHYIQVVDAVVWVFSITSMKSFTLIQHLRKEVERIRGKDFPMVILGTKVDMNDSRECDHNSAIKWANAEKVKLFEVLPMTRNTLQAPMTCLLKKINAPYVKGKNDLRLFRRGVIKSSSSKDTTSDT